MVKLGQFVEKLKNTREGDHTLLDSSLLYFGAGMSNGLLHDRHNVPALLVGTAGGRVEAGGRTLAYITDHECHARSAALGRPLGALLHDWFGVRLVFTTAGAALACGVMVFPIMVRAIRISLEAADPRLEQESDIGPA